MAVLISSREKGLGVYTVYSLILSYLASDNKLVGTRIKLLANHKVPLNKHNKTRNNFIQGVWGCTGIPPPNKKN